MNEIHRSEADSQGTLSRLSQFWAGGSSPGGVCPYPNPTSKQKIRSNMPWKCLRSLNPGVSKWFLTHNLICSREERGLLWIKGFVEPWGSVGISKHRLHQWGSPYWQCFWEPEQELRRRAENLLSFQWRQGTAGCDSLALCVFVRVCLVLTWFWVCLTSLVFRRQKASGDKTWSVDG